MMYTLAPLIVWLAQAIAPATGAIHGRVIDKDTGRPLPRAIVRLSRLDTPANTDERTAIANEQGGFTFEGLTAGRYGGFVMAPRHAMTGLAQGSGSPPGALIVNDRAVDIIVALPRTYAVNARVVDEYGDPLSGIRIEVRSADTGRRAPIGFLHGTDDLGRQRVSGLEPGRYTLCTENRWTSVAASDRPERRERLIRTCYPSSSDSEAEAIRIVRSDVDGIEIKMRRGRLATIAGTVVDASGVPAAAGFVGFNRHERGGSSGSSMQVDSQGRFRIRQVEAGRYTITGAIGGPDQPQERRPHEAGVVELAVADDDIEDVVVRLQRTIDVPGRITLEDPALPFPAPPGSGLRVIARRAGERLIDAAGESYGYMRADRTFTLSAVFGPRLLDVQNPPRGWYMKAARYGDRDALDAAIEFLSGADAPTLEVVLSNRGAMVTGTVGGEDGAPAPRAMVVAFRTTGSSQPRMASSARATPAGTFTLGPMRGGDYVIVAVPASSPLASSGEWDGIAALRSQGERITLTDLDERSVALRLAKER